MENIIEVKGLTKDYKDGKGIFDFTFSVKKGEILGLVGTNGSGKTTTIRHMMGFIKPQKGTVTIAGYDCYKDSSKVKKLVGYVPGQIDFPDVGTGTAFLKTQASLLGLKDLSYMNELIDRLKIDITAPLRRMSKGMKQKMALVVAFMAEPDIYLLDEPSTGLDPLMRDALIEIILEQKAKGKTIFMSSHIFKELEDTCDTVLFIKNGKIVNLVSREQYTNNPHEQYTIGFKEHEDLDKYLNEIKKTTDKLNIVNLFKFRNEVTVNVNMNDIDYFIKGLTKYNLEYINNDSYTLEKYYIEVIENEEEKL